MAKLLQRLHARLPTDCKATIAPYRTQYKWKIDPGAHQDTLQVSRHSAILDQDGTIRLQ